METGRFGHDFGATDLSFRCFINMPEASGKLYFPPYSSIRLVEYRDHIQLVPFASSRVIYGYGKVKATEATFENRNGGFEKFWDDSGLDEEVWVVFQRFRYEDGTEIPGDNVFMRGRRTETDALKRVEEIKGRYSMTREQALDMTRLIMCSDKERREMEDDIERDYPNYQFQPDPNVTDDYDVYQARLKVLAGLQPTTVELIKIADGIDDPQKRQKIEREAVQAYFAELAHYFTEDEIEAWQRTNPLQTGWWCHFAEMFHRPRRWVDPVNHELVFNWLRKKYNLLTAEELSDEIFKKTLIRLAPEALKKRRERLGLTTKRPSGPPPKSSGQ